MILSVNRLYQGLRVAVAAGISAIMWSSAIMGGGYARADQTIDAMQPALPVIPGAGVAIPGPAAVGAPATIVDLLKRVEQQLAESSLPDDKVLDTFLSIVTLLPNASATDLQAMRDMPSRFTQHAATAEAAGRHNEAQRFSMWAGVFAAPLPAEPGGALGQGPEAHTDQAVAAPEPPAEDDPALKTAVLPPPDSATAPTANTGSPRPLAGPATTDSDAASRDADTNLRIGRLSAIPETDASVSPRPITPSDPAGAPATIAALVTQAEHQLAAPDSLENDKVLNTILAITALLPNASAADLEILRDIPSRFTQRASVAEAAGRPEEAQQFLVWAKVFETPPATTDQGEQMAHNAPTAGIAPPPQDNPPGHEVMPRSAAPPPNVNGHAQAAATDEAAVRGSDVRQPPAPYLHPTVKLALGPFIPVKREIVKIRDTRCRAIVLKVQLGEEPSNADRVYLRQGCPPG